MRFLSREALGLAPPRHPLSPFRPPAQRLFLHHSVTPSYGDDYARAAQLIQRVAFERGFTDASYGVGVVPDGTVLELRGFDWIGAHTVNDAGDSYNAIAHAIVLVGNYDLEPVTPAQVDSVRAVRALLMAGGKLAAGSPFDPHRAVRSTACPGAHAFALMDEFRKPWVPSAPAPTTSLEDIVIVHLEGNPGLFVDGLPHTIPGPLLDAYAAARKRGDGIVHLPTTGGDAEVARSHYAKLKALVPANN